MQRVIYYQVLSVLESQSKISFCQYGFQINCSTSHPLVQAVHDWAKALNYCSSTHCLFLNFAKVFNNVPYQHLLLRLECLEISGKLLNWFGSYLTGRSLYVVISGHCSDWISVLFGVSQGSILGLLLFILYVH